jgi:hypothetical protein
MFLAGEILAMVFAVHVGDGAAEELARQNKRFGSDGDADIRNQRGSRAFTRRLKFPG